MAWEGGKVGGTIFQRKNLNSYNVVFNNIHPKITKYFSFKTYRSLENAYIEAKKYQIEQSKELKQTRNMYRKLPNGIFWNNDPTNYPLTNNSYEVHIVHNEEEYFMLMDEIDLKLVDELNVCITRGKRITKNGIKKGSPYATFTQKCTREEKKTGDFGNCNVHNKITGFSMVDHINRNTLDNRRCNLSETTPKLNMNNRGNVHNGASGILGVRYVMKDNCWQARIKQNDKEYSQCFSFKKYGDEGAKEMAINARNKMNKRFGSKNGE